MQTCVFSRLHSPWLHVDIATVFLIYVSLEYFLLGACFHCLTGALLLQGASSCPENFFPMYFLLVLCFSAFLARRMVFHRLYSQVLVVVVLLLLKTVLLGLVFALRDNTPNFSWFLAQSLPQVIISSLVAIPLFHGLSRFDQWFSIQERHQEPSSLWGG
jgi:fumarate reductase subunit D